ncbi:MAG: tetratricopeptide repeat protein [Pseudomonadota bacterium]
MPSNARYGLMAILFAAVVTVSAGERPAPVAPLEVADDTLWETYFALRELKDHDQAHEAARTLEASMAERHGVDSESYGRALAETGITLLLTGRYGESLARLDRAEAILRENLPLYSEKLVVALSFLGSALQSQGRLDEALDAFTRAQHITHRLWGANNLQQIRIAYAKADTMVALGEFYEAEELQRFAYRLHRENYGPSSPEAIEASARLGAWLRAAGEYHDAIDHFHRAIDEVQGDGPDTPEAYPLLKGLGHAYQGGYRGKRSRGVQQRVIAVVEAHPDRFTLDQQIEARLLYGDWLMQRYYERQAVAQYEAAWRLAEAAGPDGERWIQTFAAPAMVRYGAMAPQDYSGKNEFVKLSFNITKDGRIRRAKVLEENTTGIDSAFVRQEFPKETRFRPAIVDGRAVASEGRLATMYLLPPGVLLEPEPIAAPQTLVTGTDDLLSDIDRRANVAALRISVDSESDR